MARVKGVPVIYRIVQGVVWKGGHTYHRFLHFDINKKYDILVFGSSRANRGVNPAVFETAGLNVYNLGTDDQTPLNTCVLVHNYVKRENCRLVIIDLYNKVASQTGFLSSSDLIQNLNKDKPAMDMAIAIKDVRALNLLTIRTLLKNAQPDYHVADNLYKGFRSINDTVKTLSEHTFAHPLPGQLEALKETVEYLNEIDVPVVLLNQPMPLVEDNSQQLEFNEMVHESLKGLKYLYYDLSHEEFLNRSHFADIEHLNSKGADIYSRYILEEIILPSGFGTSSLANFDTENPLQEIR